MTMIPPIKRPKPTWLIYVEEAVILVFLIGGAIAFCIGVYGILT
jgi:hypothetical protein